VAKSAVDRRSSSGTEYSLLENLLRCADAVAAGIWRPQYRERALTDDTGGAQHAGLVTHPNLWFSPSRRDGSIDKTIAHREGGPKFMSGLSFTQWRREIAQSKTPVR